LFFERQWPGAADQHVMIFNNRMKIYRYFLIVFIWYVLFFPIYKTIHYDFWYDVMFYTLYHLETQKFIKLLVLQFQFFFLISFFIFWLVVLVDYLLKDRIGVKEIRIHSHVISSIVLSSLLIPSFIAIRPLIIDVKTFVPILIFVTTITVFCANKTKHLIIKDNHSLLTALRGVREQRGSSEPDR
jgi:cellulose synthase/poly-beta-1,6-N-acetylglucosamine synthase-like glycosyltransferase